MSVATDTTSDGMIKVSRAQELLGAVLRSAEYIVIPLFSVAVSGAMFSLFLFLLGKDPFAFYELLWKGGYGSWFSWQNTLVRTAPLILTALCVAIPARLGLTIIGGEGALVISGFAGAAIAIPFIGWASPWFIMPLMFLTATLTGALWIGFVGALRHYRGINETIASLLLFYIAVSILNFFVEGALRDPSDPNKPSTMPIGAANMVGKIPGMDVHWGLAFGVVMAILLYLVMTRTTFGFAARVTGGNVRAARAQGLPVGKLMVISCMIAGACAGMAGYFEVAAVLGKANAALVGGYGFTGILVSFLARHNPIAIPPVAILFGGLAAAGGLVAYLDHNAKGAIPFLRPPRLAQTAQQMAIDAATRESLELTQTTGGARKGSLLDAVDRTVTAAGARLLAADIGAPLMDRGRIEARLDLVTLLAEDSGLRESLRGTLRSMADIGRALGRLAAGRGSPRDLGQLRDGLDGAWRLGERLGAIDQPPPLLGELAPALRGHGALIDLLTRALVASPPIDASDGGYIAPGYDAALDDLRDAGAGGRRAIAALEAEFRTRTGVTALKIRHNGVLGYHIEVPARFGDALMKPESGFTHRQTMAGAIRFNAPELHEVALKVTQAGAHALAAEAAHLEDLIA
eukprot:gene20700-21387_t